MSRFVLVLLLACVVAFAQTDRGTITGTILDPAGAVVPSASIEARNTATSETYTVGTTGTGNYTLANLPAGSYELTVDAQGFKKYVRPSVTVQVAETVRIDATLEVGATSETVTVNAEAPLLKTDSGEVSHQVDYTQAESLPLFTLNGTGGTTGLGNIRDPLSVLTTLPGASFSSDNTLRVNGLPANSQAIRIDGQDATNGVWQNQNQTTQPSVDAIQEVSIQTSSFAAEYGQAGGGYINYTMKSGTNQLHGSGYDYFQNEALNAGLPFTVDSAGTGHVRNPLRRNDYGFTLGGPVRIPKLYNGKDKTFFFFSFEQFRQSTITNNLITTAPLPQWTAGNSGGNANFSDVLNPLGPGVTAGFNPGIGQFVVPSPTGSIDQMGQIFDPNTAHYVNGGALGSGIVETPFPNNTIPYSRMNPTSLKEQALFLAPNLGGIVNNELQPPYSNYRHTTIPSFKIDQSLGSKMKLAGYYNQTYTYSPNSNGLPEILAPVTDQNTRAQTIRINFDDTLTPTLLLHVGVGLVYDSQDQYPPFNNAGEILGWGPNQQYPANNIMPSVAGLSSIFSGGLALGSGFGAPTPGVSAFECCQDVKEIKPTSNASMTWVHGNHTFKWGGEVIFEGLPTQSSYRANGEYTFSNLETQNPWEYTSSAIGPSSVFTSGFPYASFLLGAPDGLVAGPVSDSRLGNHQLAFFAQDQWKVTRKLTLELGLRYDYATLLEEEHGRMQSGCFQCPNPNLVPAGSTTPLDGLVVYQKQYNQNYPFGFGPRLGIAYQINSKTVFRAGGGIAYSATSNNYGLSATDIDFQSIIAPKGTGQGLGGSCNAPGMPCILFSDGNPFAPGNRFGNAIITFPTTGANFPRQTSATGCGPVTGPLADESPCIPAEDPFITIDKGTGRLPRIFQWSIGLQREIIPNLLIEASYVGNRGAWWESAVLDQEALNGLTPQQLLSERMYGNTTGINVQNPAQAGLLLQPISSPSVIAAFPALANPNVVYNGFPGYEPLLAALVPHPQWYGGVPPFLGPPLGDTWYDSLQVKLTKRYSRGLTVQGAYTWQKELTNGANANTAYLSPSSPIIGDPYCRPCSKQLSGLSFPQVLLVTFTYTTPKNKFGGDSFGGKMLQWLSRDWSFGGVLRYQSGQLLQTPPSENNLVNELIGPGNNPGIWGGSATLENYVPGQPFFLVNPNSHFDPTTTLVLNPNAFTDAPLGTFGVSAPYYNQNRWQRQPAESLSVGRIFRIKEKYQLQIRAEFQNVFNRVFYPTPADGAGTGTYTAPAYVNPFPVAGSTTGALSGGYGFVNSFNGAGAQPRTGQLVGRFVF